MQGTTIGSYRVTRQLGRGGMGAVYLAEHTLLGRKAAIKTLLPALSNDQEQVQRFFNEAKAVTAVKHPGIIEIYDFGFRENGTAYIVMEYLEGETLKARLQRLGRLTVKQAVEFTKQVASALGAAHARGIIHRDLKPDNIFLVTDPEIGERVKILDFGIAKLIGPENSGGHRTRTGALMGTPSYMSPEQCRGAGKVDLRGDLYSLGCILFEMLCGQPPFVREGLGAILGAHMYEPPPTPRSLNPSLGRGMEGLVLRLLAKEPSDRFASSGDLIGALTQARTAPGTGSATSQQQPHGPHLNPHDKTTLSGAGVAVRATETLSPPPGKKSRSRWSLVIAALVVLAIAISGTAWYVSSDTKRIVSASTPDNSPLAANEQTPANEQPVAERVATGGNGSDAEALASKETAVITIELNSTPSEADVFQLGSETPIGVTPYKKQLIPSDGNLQFVIKKRDFKSRRVTLKGDRDEKVDIKLEHEQRVVSADEKASETDESLAKPAETKPIDEKALEGGGHVDPF